MSCYKWELEAILEGLALKNVDERENLAELAANVRYTIHAKKVKANKLFDKRKEENKIHRLFRKNTLNVRASNSLAERVQRMNDYFRNKNKKEE